MSRIFIIGFILAIHTLCIHAEMKNTGSIRGLVVEKTSGTPLEFATIVVKNEKDTTKITGGITDKNGVFDISGLAYGEYKVSYSYIGFDKINIPKLKLNAGQKTVNLGKLYIWETSKSLAQVDVIGQHSTFVNSIDRKTFNVGTDLMSKSGSVSDLMMNIPSVQVDVEGNVSLRGSENVTILIDGKPSAMMKINRAAVLQQISANTIEKIEIITNPSAKYKPDGTSGIINIVLKKNGSLGFNGSLTANIGNGNRRNFNVLANYNPGKLNIYASFGIRQEDRIRINDVSATTFLSSGLQDELTKTYNQGLSRSTSYIGSTGLDYKLNDKNTIRASINYNYRGQIKNENTNITLLDNNSVLVYDFDRSLYLPEMESDIESNTFFQHRFNEKGHELNVNFITSISNEIEDNHYINTYIKPTSVLSYDNMLYKRLNMDSEFSIEYTLPINENSKFETGYLLEHFANDMDLKRDTLVVTTNKWNNDSTRSNQFIHSEDTHVLYGTYEQEIGNFGFLVGVRAEQTFSKSNLVTLDSVINIQYTRLYPTLHLSYKLSDIHELQLNYSHRIKRPDDEDLNPFPEFKDLNNIRAGNPKLKPEDIHSFEMGYQLKKKSTTFLSTLYYRNKYNSMTSITKSLGNGVLLSTLENLGKSQSAGLELILSTSISKFLSMNLATNTFYNTIDASALGFSSNKSNFSWTANGNVSFNLTKSTFWQITSNYSAKTLTPQGYRLPAFVMNTGLKQELFNRKAALILTVSDIFNSNRSYSVLDTPQIYRTEIRKRSSQIIYFGFTYNFGSTTKKQKESQIKYDNQL